MEKERRTLRICQVCGKRVSVYKCPRCFRVTCSLACCKQHKIADNCDGKRDRTAYVSIARFTDSNLKSDFHFLEDVLRVSDGAKRLRENIGIREHLQPRKRGPIRDGSTTESNPDSEASDVPVQPLLSLSLREKIGNHCSDDVNSDPNNAKRRKIIDDCSRQYSQGLKRLVKEASNRGIDLLLMPYGMEKRKKNNTAYKAKTDTILWKVEWAFHVSGDKRMSPSSTRILDRFSEMSILETELCKITKKLVTSDRSAQFANSENLLLFIKILPCSSKNAKYVKVDKAQSLRQALQGLTIIEFPTVEVVHEKNVSLFQTLIEEITPNT